MCARPLATLCSCPTTLGGAAPALYYPAIWSHVGNNSLQYSTPLQPRVKVITVFVVCTYTHDHGMVVYIPYVMYRLRGNKFTETGKTRLHQAEEQRKKLTGFEKLYLFT